MYISRGFQGTGEKLERASEPGPAPAPQSIEYHLVHDRLAMLERLTALRAANTLSEAEFLAEKERILALPAEELVLRPAVPLAQGPSLLGRMLNGKVLALGLLLGFCLGLFARPDEALRTLEQIGWSQAR